MNRSGKYTGTVRGKTLSGVNFEKPKTLSYSQLKEENGALHQRNGELEQKFSRQSSALTTAQRNAKTFEKENKSLKEQLEGEQQLHAEHIERLTYQWTSTNGILADKLSRCEVKLDNLGVNPVSLEDCSNVDQWAETKQEAMAHADVLRERLKDNIGKSQNFLLQIKEMKEQTTEALGQLEC